MKTIKELVETGEWVQFYYDTQTKTIIEYNDVNYNLYINSSKDTKNWISVASDKNTAIKKYNWLSQ